MKEKIIIGTRGSKLALWQANFIADCLRTQYKGLAVELKHITTKGDKILDVPLAKIGGKGLFTKELEEAMLSGEIDIAVHSLKDMPTLLPEGLILAAVTERADPGDALVSRNYGSFDALPQGARLGTSSLRRRAQMLACRPDLQVFDLRGNVDTRLRKLDEGTFDAVILAAAGLKRLGFSDRIRQILPTDICLPAVGQGALAIEAREKDAAVLEILAFLDHADTRAATAAERAFLRTVEGGCQVPVGVYAVVEANEVHLEALIADLEGKKVLRSRLSGAMDAAETLGESLALRLLEQGGREILESAGCLSSNA